MRYGISPPEGYPQGENRHEFANMNEAQEHEVADEEINITGAPVIPQGIMNPASFMKRFLGHNLSEGSSADHDFEEPELPFDMHELFDDP